MKKKITIEQELSLFLEDWNFKKMESFLKEIMAIAELFDVDEGDDWVLDQVGSEDCANVRLVKAAYFISRLAEFQTGKLLKVKTDFPRLWERMQAVANDGG